MVGPIAAHSYRGWSMSIAQLFGSGPKFTITCGNCRATFKKRIPMISHPGIVCPRCSTVNILDVVAQTGVE